MGFVWRLVLAESCVAVNAVGTIPDRQPRNGMIEGRISKELKEVCLVDQVYVKAEDGKQTVAKYLDEVSKAVGCTVKVKRFVRFETGEGLEKKNEDFAAEVAAQMGN